MDNILEIFKSDLLALKKNVISTILIVGLVVMPSMFVWYNVLACWDVFNNTSNLKVAVANNDEGFEGELLPTKVNVGQSVVSALRENSQLEWVFTTETDAINGVCSGQYYAALVIPESFSCDLMDFYTDEAKRAPIAYYSNEKKSAIAPKITDQGATQISYQINNVFAKSLNEIFIKLINDVIELSDDDGVSSNIDSLIERIDKSSKELHQHSLTLSNYENTIDTIQNLAKTSNELLSSAKSTTKDINNSISQVNNTSSGLIASLETPQESFLSSIDSCVKLYQNMYLLIDEIFVSANTSASQVSASLNSKVRELNEQEKRYETIISNLNEISEHVDEMQKEVIVRFVAILQTTSELNNEVIKHLDESSSKIVSSNSELKNKRVEIKTKVNEAIESLRSVKKLYVSDIKPKLDDMLNRIDEVFEKLSQNYSNLDAIQSEISSSISNFDSKMENSKSIISNASDELNLASQNLEELYTKLNSAKVYGGVDKVKEIISNNPSLLAENLSSPVGIKRIAEFPVSNFGSAMSPLYSTLGLWVGCLLSVVLIRVNPSKETLIKCKNNIRMHEVFIGRFGVFAVVSLLQSCVMSFGNIVFLGVQTTDPILYVLCFFITGVVFQFIMYTLVASFGNVGKAIGVLLLIVQVTGSGGSFPLQLLPSYATIINPFLPATYAIEALRCSMMGIFELDYFVHIAKLLLFLIPMAIIGLIFRKPFVKINEMFVNKAEKSKLI